MIALVAALACVLVTGTSFAAYRTMVGPRQCCKSHCGHAMPKRAAAQCCRAHPAVPGTTVNVTASQDVAAPMIAALPAPSLVVPTAFGAFESVADRAPPGGSTLLALHTSLAL